MADFRGEGRGWILLAIAFGWFLGLGIRLAAPVLVTYVRADFGFDLATAGLLLTTLWATYALFQFPGGALGDRVGERTVLVASSTLAIGALVAGALAWSVLALFGGFALLGIATGVYATTRFTALSDLFPERSATAIGLSSAAGNLGTVVLPAGLGLFAGVLGWRAGFGAAAPAFALAAVALWLSLPARTSGPESAVDELSVATVRRLARGIVDRRVVVFTAAMFAMSFVYQGFTSFYPSYLVEVKGLSEGISTVAYSTFFAAGIAVQPLAGTLADRVGERSAVVVFTAVTALGLLALLWTATLPAILAVSVLLSAQLGFWPVAQAAVVDALPGDMQGTGFGFLRTVYLLFAATAPTVVGVLGDRGDLGGAFLLLAGVAGAAALLGLLLADS